MEPYILMNPIVQKEVGRVSQITEMPYREMGDHPDQVMI